MRQGALHKVLTIMLLSMISLAMLSVAGVVMAETNSDQNSSNGSKKTATLSSADVVLTETNVPLKAHGKLTIKDVDSPETFVAQEKDGDYGTFNIDASGAWTYATKSALDYLDAGDSLSDSFTVSSSGGATTTVKITIKGTNDPAILSSADVVLNETNEPLTANGKLTNKDVDSPQTFVAQKKAGSHGTFSIDTSGAWTYVANSAFDYLNEGQSVSDKFTVSSADGTTTTVKVAINGTNDPAILSSADVVLTETNDPLSTSGKLTIKDVDSPETFIAQKKDGDYGTFNIDASGAWTYVTNGALDYLKAGQLVSDKFTVSSADGTTTTVKVTIKGTNDPAILSSADFTLTETNVPLKAQGKLTIKDVDSPETFVAQKKVSDYGTFKIDASGAWTYVTKSALDELKEGQVVSDNFTVSSADGTTTTVKVTIKGTNDPAILSTADVALNETNVPLKASGKLTIKDVDSPETFKAQSNVAGDNGTFNIDASGAWTYEANSAFDYLNVGQNVGDQFTVSSADGTTTTVKVTINGTNDPAILSAADVILTETNEPLSTSGKLTIKDVDSPATFVAQKKVSKYGTFNIDTTGAWTYVTNSALDYLNVGKDATDIFTVSSADGTTTTVKITIKGTNDPAILGSADVVLDETNAPLKTGGKLTIKDVDSPETFVPQSKVAGTHGTFNINTSGAWTYVANSAFDELNVGQSLSDIFTVSSADGTTTTVKVTINGTNDPAILSSADVVLTETNEPLTTGGKLSIKDVDSPETFKAQSNVAGDNGTFNIDTSGAWTYVANSAFKYLNVGQSVKDSFTVSSADGTTTTVKITIKGINDPAILSSADVVLTETNEPLSTSGRLTITDVDSPETFVAQKKVSKYGTFNIDTSGAWTYVTNSALDYLNVGKDATDIFTVSSADGTTTTVKVTIKGTNDPAILSSAAVELTETNAPLKAHGKLTINDVDSPETFVAEKKDGDYGTVSIDASGAWSYVTKSALDELKEGQVVNDNFTVSSADGTTTTIKITIIGTNDPAILSSADISLDETNEPLKTGGKLTIKDVDSPETFVAQSNVAGANGTFNIDTSGTWTYVANSAFDELKPGQSISDKFTVASADGTTTTVKVTINGTNDPAILSADEVVLTETNEPLNTSGKLTIKDVDSPETFVAQKKVSDYGTFNIDASGAWTYVTNSALDYLNVDRNAVDIFTVSSADGTTTTVKITINGTNDPAILSADDIALDETNVPLKFTGKLTISDVDSPETFKAQNKVAGNNGTFNIDASGAWTYVANSAFDELNVGQSLGDIFTVSSADGTTTTVKVTINGTNDPAILGAADVELTETNEPLRTSGRLTISDVDSPQTFVAQSKVEGSNGIFSIDSSGAWSYATYTALDELNVGRNAGDIFTVSSADGTTTTVKVTINGTNDPAILSSADIVMDETNEPLTASGKLTISDVDDPETFVVQDNVAVANGIFSIDASGAWTYVANDAFDNLNEGDYIGGIIPVTSFDGTPTTIKITINGTNDPAILSSADVVLNETNAPLSTSGKLSISDVDSAQTFVEQKNIPGANGIFNIDASGAWTYVANSAFDYLNIGDKLVDNFVVCSADGTTTTVQVTINGTNDPAILSSAKIDLDEIEVPQKAKGKLTIKDVDNPETFVVQKDFAGTTGTFNIDLSGAWNYVAKSNFEELKKGQTVSDNFIVTSSDGTTTSVKITIHGTEPSEFRGKYFGGRMGINRSSTTGTTAVTNQPKATTLAYGLQGGYLQAGYNWDLKDVVAGIGAYLDWNNYAVHSTLIGYSSRSVGLDFKLGLPIGDFLPYVKRGYGYNMVPQDKVFPSVTQKRPSGAIGIEYNFANRWSATTEYKVNNFSNQDGSIKIYTKIFSFGLSYYFDIPRIKKAKVEAVEVDIPIPEATIAPDAVPDAPPPP